VLTKSKERQVNPNFIVKPGTGSTADVIKYPQGAGEGAPGVGGQAVRSDAAQKLLELGYDQEAADRLGDIITRELNGEPVTPEEKAAIEADYAANGVLLQLLYENVEIEHENVNSENIKTEFGKRLRHQAFTIQDWTGYPDVKRPTGPFIILEGDEYINARKLANNTNANLHKMNENYVGMQIHEIHPVKFGGSPTDLNNKVVLTPKNMRNIPRFGIESSKNKRRNFNENRNIRSN